VSGAIMGVFLLGMLWPWANKTGALYGTLSSLLVVVWIVISGQLAISSGELKYPPLPTRIDGCERHGYNLTDFMMYVRG
jgi:solute carrier family 5 (sodium-coupled monocarboxylate transporter), member 8/12